MAEFSMNNFELMKSKMVYFFQSQVDEWIKATDYDSDGKITLEEFKLGVAGTALIEDF